MAVKCFKVKVQADRLNMINADDLNYLERAIGDGLNPRVEVYQPKRGE